MELPPADDLAVVGVLAVPSFVAGAFARAPVKNGCVLFELAVVAGFGVAGVIDGCCLTTGAAAGFAGFWPLLPFADSGAGGGKGKTLWVPLNTESTKLLMRTRDSGSCDG